MDRYSPIRLAFDTVPQGLGCLLYLLVPVTLLLPWFDIGLASRGALNFFTGWLILLMLIPTGLVTAWSIAASMRMYPYASQHRKWGLMASGVGMFLFGAAGSFFVSWFMGSQGYTGFGALICFILCQASLFLGFLRVLTAPLGHPYMLPLLAKVESGEAEEPASS